LTGSTLWAAVAFDARKGLVTLAQGRNMQAFSLRVTDGRTADARVLLVGGEVDLQTAPLLSDRAGSVLRQEAVHELAVDLGGVTFIDSTGLNALVGLSNLSGQLGKSLILRNVSARVLTVMGITGLDRLFAIEGR
jgi:anti-sigma B factor antagonist